jgi:hypothetical protein
MSKPKYATVPITLLKNIHKDQVATIRQMFDYAVYDRMIKEFSDMDEDDLSVDEIEFSLKYFCIVPNRLESRLQDGKELYHKYNTDPNASISVELLLKFQEKKTEFELMVFSFYCAIRSMIGTKAYYKGTDDYWILRAFGYSSNEDFENNITTSQNRDLIAKYSMRYHKDKIKKVLQNEWFLIYYSNHVRGYYASFKMDFKSLVNIAEDKKDLSKQKELLRKQEVQQILADRTNRKNLKN